MNLAHPFYRFPLRFDAAQLRAEINALPEEAWCPHPEGFPGNSALPLISTGGGVNDDFRAPLRPTQRLADLPYVRQVLASFETLLGRTRLMRLEADAGVPAHVDVNYYWRTHTRVHIPVTTHPGVQFHCGNQVVHMAEGEAWTFDNWQVHKVTNPTPTRRIHLVFDTLGSAAFWQMARPLGAPLEERFVAYRPGGEPSLSCEGRPADQVMAPGDVDLTLQQLLDDATAHPGNDRAALLTLQEILLELRRNWRITWFASEINALSVGKFIIIRAKAGQGLKQLEGPLSLASNNRPAIPIFLHLLNVMIEPTALHGLRGRAPGPSEMPSAT